MFNIEASAPDTCPAKTRHHCWQYFFLRRRGSKTGHAGVKHSNRIGSLPAIVYSLLKLWSLAPIGSICTKPYNVDRHQTLWHAWCMWHESRAHVRIEMSQIQRLSCEQHMQHPLNIILHFAHNQTQRSTGQRGKTAERGTAQRSTAQHSAAQRSTAQHSTA